MPGFGRLPSPPDPRDVPLRLLHTAASPLDAALAVYAHTRSQSALLAWMRLVTAAVQQAAPPAPTPPPVRQARIWRDATDPILDQGDTGHCVGFSGAGLLADPEPRTTGVTNDTGHELYYRCKDVDADGSANREAGSYVRTLAKVLRDQGRIGAYAWATNTNDIAQWLWTRGPVVVGTDWYSAMMDPPANGVIQPLGHVVGGHAYVLVGVTDVHGQPVTELTTGHSYFMVQNSWGRAWGNDGTALIEVGDFGRQLLARDGEAMVTVDLPLG